MIYTRINSKFITFFFIYISDSFDKPYKGVAVSFDFQNPSSNEEGNCMNESSSSSSSDVSFNFENASSNEGGYCSDVNCSSNNTNDEEGYDGEAEETCSTTCDDDLGTASEIEGNKTAVAAVFTIALDIAFTAADNIVAATEVVISATNKLAESINTANNARDTITTAIANAMVSADDAISSIDAARNAGKTADNNVDNIINKATPATINLAAAVGVDISTFNTAPAMYVDKSTQTFFEAQSPAAFDDDDNDVNDKAGIRTSTPALSFHGSISFDDERNIPASFEEVTKGEENEGI
jgi:hypothetical protein